MKQLLRKIGIVAGTVAMAGLAAPLLVPLPPLEGTVTPEELADPESRFIRLDKTNIRYRRRGHKGPFFIFLHGYLRTLYSWHLVFDHLNNAGSSIAYDRPAFGLTSRPMPGEWKGQSPYGYRAQAEMVVRMMDAFGIDRALLVGHAMGATIAALASKLYPRRIERVILVSPEPFEKGKPAWQRLLMATPQMRRLGPVMLRNRVAGQMEEMLQKSWHEPEKISPEMKFDYEKIFRAHDWDRGFWELARAAEPLESLFSFDTIQVPTLVIAGENDGIVGTQRVIQTAAAMRNAHLALIPEAGHAPHEESPGAFVDAIQEYIDTLHPAGTA